MHIPLSKMYIDDEIRQAVLEVLDSGRYINGDNLRAFEEEFAHFCGVRHAVGVSSGTSAILLTLRAFGIGEGDEVIAPAHTFVATASPAVFLGASVVYADIDPETCNIDPAEVRKLVSPRTRAVVPVHLYGHPCDMDAINELAETYGFRVIEDACQSHGAAYKGRRTGSLGDAACFSFFPSKNMTVLGDGGMMTTDDGKLAEEVRMLRDHGRTRKHVHELLGLNFRLSEIHAAIGRLQLRHLSEWNTRRREIARRYGETLAGSGVTVPIAKDWAEHVYYMYVIRTDRRDELASFLRGRGIETGIHYPVPLHQQPCVKADAHLPVTEKCVDEILSLPMHPQLTDSEVERVAAAVKEFMEGANCQG